MYFKLERTSEIVKAEITRLAGSTHREKVCEISYMVENMTPREEEGLADEVGSVMLVPSAPHYYMDECKPRLSSHWTKHNQPCC